MAIAQVSNASYASGTASTSIAFSGLTAGAGNIQVVFIAMALGTTATITPPTNYVLLHRSDSSTTATVATYLSSVLVAAPSFTITSSIHAGVCVELSGANTSVDTDSALQDAGGTQTNSAQGGTAITPTLANDRLLAFYALQGTGNSNSVGTPPAGYTEITPTGGVGGATTPIVRAYYLDNPALSSTAPTIIWNQGLAQPGFAYVAVSATLQAQVLSSWQRQAQRGALMAQ